MCHTYFSFFSENLFSPSSPLLTLKSGVVVFSNPRLRMGGDLPVSCVLMRDSLPPARSAALALLYMLDQVGILILTCSWKFSYIFEVCKDDKIYLSVSEPRMRPASSSLALGWQSGVCCPC